MTLLPGAFWQVDESPLRVLDTAQGTDSLELEESLWELDIDALGDLAQLTQSEEVVVIRDAVKPKRYSTKSWWTNLIFIRRRTNKKRIEHGNNDSGRAGKQRCVSCRGRKRKVSPLFSSPNFSASSLLPASLATFAPHES
jgi:hypothetical protein